MSRGDALLGEELDIPLVGGARLAETQRNTDVIN